MTAPAIGQTPAAATVDDWAQSCLPPRPRVTLGGVSWDTYLALRAAEENAHVRMTYRSGTLDLMTTSRLHELYKELLGYFVTTWCVERGVAFRPAGSATQQSAEGDAAIEPDASFFVGSVQRDIDSADGSPPPDLAIEIDLSTNSAVKLPAYAAVGIAEVWFFDGDRLRVRTLAAGEYSEAAQSTVLAGFPTTTIPEWLQRGRHQDTTSLLEAFRASLGSEGEE